MAKEGWGKKIFSGKPVLFTLCLGLITPYSTGLFVWNIYHTFIIVCAEFWLSFDPQIRPTRFAINFLFNTARGERKVCLCLKLFYFFLRWILIRLTSNLSRFVPNSVKILTWNFSKKLILEKISEILWKTKAISTKIWVISPYFLQFYFGFILRWKISKKFTQVLLYVVFTQLGRHFHKQITKEGRGKKIEDIFFPRKPLLFTLGLGLITPYSTGLFLWNIYHTFLIVCAEFWLRFDPQICATRFAINFLSTLSGLKGRFVCVWNCLIFFLGEYSSVWPEIWRVLSLIQSRFLHGISVKNYFLKIFLKFCEKPRISSIKNLSNFATLSAILLWVYIALKKIEKIHTGTFICCFHPAREARP